uniref:Uncharacterized protein n=1 Tax=Photinus pyralis TaxID=7054 RepID=A0A1Y1LI59_PHOPY
MTDFKTMDGNEDISKLNDSNNQYYSLYRRLWNASDPAVRNFFVDTDTLDVHTPYWEHMTIVPILATIMLIATVFLLVLFRHSPSMVAGTVAACLTMIAIYLILSSVNESRIRFS